MSSIKYFSWSYDYMSSIKYFSWSYDSLPRLHFFQIKTIGSKSVRDPVAKKVPLPFSLSISLAVPYAVRRKYLVLKASQIRFIII